LAFSGTTDSTSAQPDKITNFDPASDRLDFSEIPGIASARSLGAVTSNPTGIVVAANSAAWLIDTGTNQTIVYVNPTSAPESAVAASMKIVLNGKLSLSSSDFVLSEPPLTLPPSTSLLLPAGGSASLPISVSGMDYGDVVSVVISGLTSYESVTDSLDHATFGGTKTGSVVLTAAEVNSGLTLNSSYAGSGQPKNTLTVTATNVTPGETSEASPPQTITVTDPPSTTSETSISGLSGTVSDFSICDVIDLGNLAFGAHSTLGYSGDNSHGTISVSDGTHTAKIALLGQYMASSFATASDEHGGTLVTDSPTWMQNTLLTHPHH
jgi:hypothetical protein